MKSRNTRFPLCLILLSLFGINPCLAVDGPATIQQARTEVRDAFSKTVASRLAGAAAAEPKRIHNAGAEGYSDYSTRVFTEELFRIAKVVKEGSPAEAEPYKSAIIDELKGTDPSFRALACEMLGLSFDPTVLPILGDLLDDTTEAAPAPHRTSAQTGPNFTVWIKQTVGQAARGAIRAGAQISVESKETFEVWWKGNSDFKNRIWYWSALYKRQRGAQVVCLFKDRNINMLRLPTLVPGEVTSSGIIPMVLPKITLPMPDELPAETGLKMLLLYKNYAAVNCEVAKTYSGSRRRLAVSCDDIGTGITPDDIAKFVRKNEMKERLLQLLAQKNLYPEVCSQDAFDRLIKDICEVGKLVLGPADERRVAAAEGYAGSAAPPPYRPPLSPLILLRAEIAPERAQAILTEAMRREPCPDDIPKAFIEKFGCIETDLLSQVFAVASDEQKNSIALAVRDVAKANSPVSPAFISYLVENIKGPEVWYSQESLKALSQAANAVLKRDVISDSDLRRLSPGKIFDHDEYLRLKADIPVAFNEIKAQLLAALAQ